MSHSDPQSSQPDAAPELPAALQAELRAMYEPPEAFSARRDADLLQRVHRQHASRASSGSRRWMLSAAVAATVVLTAGILLYFQSVKAPGPAAVYARTGDIRDAFYLARRLNAHQRPGADWDANHDGVVDQADVQSLAMAAVRLDRVAAPVAGGAR